MATEGDQLVREIVAAAVVAAGYDLETVVIRPAGSKSLVRVVIDSDQGVDLDRAADLSREISAGLDAHDDAVLSNAAYTLEVTSRGIDTPLTEPRHFRRAAGRSAVITMVDGTAERVRIAAVDGDDVIVLTGKNGLDVKRLAMASIAGAVVQVEFSSMRPEVAALVTQVASGALGSDAITEQGEDPR